MRVALTWMSALLLCGCLGRGSTDLLHARLREQQDYVAEMERQKDSAVAELKRSQREAEQLRAELDRSGKRIVAAEYTESLVRASKLQINSLTSGGLNRDNQPGDDSLVAFISLVDDDGEVIKLPGTVELTLLDPSLPEPSRQVGHWRFSAEDCRRKWTRGFTGSGYQFTVSLEQAVQNEQLVLHAKVTTADKRTFDANQLVRFTVAADSATPRRVAVPADDKPLDDINDPPPAPGDPATGSAKLSDLPVEWEEPEDSQPDIKPVRDSSGWTKDEVPVRR